MNTAALARHCWRVDCDQDRLGYAPGCAEHTPGWTPPPPTRCQRPLRCYCPATPECLGHDDNLPTWRKPGPPPPEVRAQLDELAARRAERRRR